MLSVVCCICPCLQIVLSYMYTCLYTFLSFLQGHHGQGSQPLRENQGKLLLIFPVREFGNKCGNQGIWSTWQELLTSHHSHIGLTTLMFVCVHVCVYGVYVCDLGSEQIWDPHLNILWATHHLGSIVSLPSSHYYWLLLQGNQTLLLASKHLHQQQPFLALHKFPTSFP